MSVSSLPEWKQLLLEKKRREEEERERREKEEEEKLASMPAWKRGIIQRRKAKQESVGDKEKDRDALSQVSLETIVPVHENPFIRTQSAWRKGRDADIGNEPEIKEKEKEKSSPKGQDGESGRERGIELKIERFRDLSEGREKERSRDRSQGRERENSRERLERDKSQSQWKESVKDVMREREMLKVRKDEEEKETDPPSGDESCFERKMRERIYSDKSMAPWVDLAGLGRETTAKIKMGCARLLDKDRFGKHRDGHVKNEGEKGGSMQGRNEAEMSTSIQNRSEIKKVEPVDRRAAEKASDADGDEGFTVASVKNTEGISFARRVPIRQDGKARAERDVKRLTGEKSLERELSMEKDSEAGEQVKQTITVNPSFLRSQSPDNTLKPSDCAPTPASSPSSPSPAQSPSVSPSPTPSPTLFSIRSASGGQVKRGTGSTTGSTSAGTTPAKTTSQQAQITTAVAEPTKKKFPTVEEIEVIGGYQNLEKSCLVKNRGTPKKVKVCFDEDQLEQVCEYPSETSMLVCTPYPHDLGRPQGEEAQLEEADVEGGAIVSKSTSNVGTATGRGLRVGQCHPLLKKHNV
uniref:Protein phosphatase 1 regulatory subunit 18 n=1 Tax=Seriola lalandi dorsalis TaxID=1841481 RepID=A0A3B4YP41_SERLL